MSGNFVIVLAGVEITFELTKGVKRSVCGSFPNH